MKKLLTLGLLLCGLMLPFEASATISLVSSSYGSQNNGSTVTSGAINTTGATLIVVTCESNVAPTGVSNTGTADSWNLLTTYGGSNAYTVIAYAYAPATNTSQTFTCAIGSSDKGYMTVMAWSGTLTTSAVLQTSTGSTTVTPGSITPTVAGELFISSLSTRNSTSCPTITPPGSFTEVLAGGGCPNAGGNYNPADAAYYVNSGSGAVNPTWSITGSPSSNASSMAAFLPAVTYSNGFPGFMRSSADIPWDERFDFYDLWKFQGGYFAG
jgi:hypothetical protein